MLSQMPNDLKPGDLGIIHEYTRYSPRLVMVIGIYVNDKNLTKYMFLCMGKDYITNEKTPYLMHVYHDCEFDIIQRACSCL